MKSVKYEYVITFSILVMFFYNVNAQEGNTGLRNITGFGCHLNDGTCYFDIDGLAVGPVECVNNNVRFDSINSAGGKTWLSIIQIAITTKRRITLNIEGCYSNQPAYPTFKWGRLELD